MATKCLVRATLRYVEDDSPIVVDLIIDSNGRVIGDMFMFGAVGEPNLPDYYPFMLDKQGRLDYGNTWAYDDPDERYGWLNIVEKVVRVGEYCTLTDNEGDHTYLIDRIDQIGLVDRKAR